MAVVVPIFKKGNKHEASNYRPVSLTSVPCKVLESIIRDAFVTHLEEKKVLRRLPVWVHEGEIYINESTGNS